MNKIVVKICTGTMCYVMGGAELELLPDSIPAELQDKVEIKGATCLDFCNQEGHGKAPFVLVGETLVTAATISKVLDQINYELKIKNSL